MYHSTKRNLTLLSVLALVALGLSGCSNSSSSGLNVTTPTPSQSTETFTGSIGQNGTAVQPFTVKNDGYTVLAGYTSLSPTTMTTLGMGIGYWDATTSTCGLNVLQADAAKVGSTALSGTAYAGNYCIRVYDAGNITDSSVTVTYTFQVQHY